MRTLIESFAAIEQAVSRVIDEAGRPDPIVRIYFSDRKTVAELVKGGKVVKTAEARCNPKDTYSRSEGAKIAVARLFEKKKPVANDDEIKKAIAAGVTEAHEDLRKAKRGDKYVVIGGGDYHCFGIGEAVTLLKRKGRSSFFKNCHGDIQVVDNEDVRPWKESAK